MSTSNWRWLSFEISRSDGNELSILTTHIATQGLLLENGKHVIFADTEAEISMACNSALNNHSQLNMLAHNGYEHAHQCYEWDVLHEPLLNYYQNNCV